MVRSKDGVEGSPTEAVGFLIGGTRELPIGTVG